MSQYRPPAYEPPRVYRQPPQPSYPHPPQHVQHVVHHYQTPPKSSGTAVLLEVLPGFFFQTFGIGHIYAGNVGTGLLFMFGYWVVQFVNLLLCLLIVGFITLPLCFILAMVISPILASNAAQRRAANTGYRNAGYR
jgi:TM2 domain-containing membrane protein YozV